MPSVDLFVASKSFLHMRRYSQIISHTMCTKCICKQKQSKCFDSTLGQKGWLGLSPSASIDSHAPQKDVHQVVPRQGWPGEHGWSHADGVFFRTLSRRPIQAGHAN